MMQFLLYPLDVIKTNRIVESNLAKEGVESVPREFFALYEKGGLQSGAMRGFLMAIALSGMNQFDHGVLLAAPVVTAVQ
tara:strand:+ start:94 stop:330 length:237 start_codon:yes stop_codon:yes gene_type:complete